MPTSEHLKSGDFFFGPAAPPPIEFANTTRILPPSNFAGKTRIYLQGLQVVEYSSDQILAYIGVRKKKLSSICLQLTTCITQENKARNRNTSIRSQMILEFWNIWSLNLIFFVGNWSKLPFIWWFLVTRENWHI